MTPHCTYCGCDVDPRYAYQRVTGWEHKGSASSRRGGSDVVRRERLEDFCCVPCMQLLQLGLNVGQGSLMEEGA